jgi:hypothetical protein
MPHQDTFTIEYEKKNNRRTFTVPEAGLILSFPTTTSPSDAIRATYSAYQALIRHLGADPEAIAIVEASISLHQGAVN